VASIRMARNSRPSVRGSLRRARQATCERPGRRTNDGNKPLAAWPCKDFCGSPRTAGRPPGSSRLPHVPVVHCGRRPAGGAACQNVTCAGRGLRCDRAARRRRLWARRDVLAPHRAELMPRPARAVRFSVSGRRLLHVASVCPRTASPAKAPVLRFRTPAGARQDLSRPTPLRYRCADQLQRHAWRCHSPSENSLLQSGGPTGVAKVRGRPVAPRARPAWPGPVVRESRAAGACAARNPTGRSARSGDLCSGGPSGTGGELRHGAGLARAGPAVRGTRAAS